MTQSENLLGVIFVMIGPGGAGKNAIMRAILDQSDTIVQLATATTRPMRETEQQGREHLFVTLDEFKQMIKNNDLLEYQEVTPNRFYGIPRKPVADKLADGHILIADIDVLGAKELARAFNDHVIQIFVTVPGTSLEEKLDVLKARMTKREDNTTQVETRLERARTLEFPYQEHCNYVVVNDELDHAVQVVSDIIQQELKLRQLSKELP